MKSRLFLFAAALLTCSTVVANADDWRSKLKKSKVPPIEEGREVPTPGKGAPATPLPHGTDGHVWDKTDGNDKFIAAALGKVRVNHRAAYDAALAMRKRFIAARKQEIGELEEYIGQLDRAIDESTSDAAVEALKKERKSYRDVILATYLRGALPELAIIPTGGEQPEGPNMFQAKIWADDDAQTNLRYLFEIKIDAANLKKDGLDERIAAYMKGLSGFGAKTDPHKAKENRLQARKERLKELKSK